MNGAYGEGILAFERAGEILYWAGIAMIVLAVVLRFLICRRRPYKPD